MPPNADKTSIYAQLRPPSKSLGGHFFFNLWHKLGTELDLRECLYLAVWHHQSMCLSNKKMEG